MKLVKVKFEFIYFYSYWKKGKYGGVVDDVLF